MIKHISVLTTGTMSIQDVESGFINLATQYSPQISWKITGHGHQFPNNSTPYVNIYGKNKPNALFVSLYAKTPDMNNFLNALSKVFTIFDT